MRRQFIFLHFLIICLLVACTSPLMPVEEFRVITHPDGPLYVGDQVSFEVLPPPGFITEGHEVRVSADNVELGHAVFAPYGVGGRMEATLTWVWDTRELQTGHETLTFSLLPDGPSWQETFTLHPQGEVPPPEPGAAWAVLTSDCCSLNYITGTDAGRDIVLLAQVVDEQAADLTARMDESLSEKIPVVFMPRVLGHGGFSSNAIYVSYLDSDYLGSTTAQVLHHELAHWFDSFAGGDLRPTIFQEGLAVYMSGGHFKPEPLIQRAAGLLKMGWYIPLRELADDFYPQQHEIGYLEAAALVDYMVESYGWETFNAFYRDIHATPDGRDSQAIDAGLQEHFGMQFSELEESYLDFLRGQLVPPATRQDLCLSVQFYDTVRRYQQAFDPSAYFMTAWLPDYSIMSQRGIVADYLRHADGMLNRLIEVILVHANHSLQAGEFEQARRILTGVNFLLDIFGWKTKNFPQDMSTCGKQ